MREEPIEPRDELSREVRKARYYICANCNRLFTEKMVVEHGAMCESCQKRNAEVWRLVNPSTEVAE